MKKMVLRIAVLSVAFIVMASQLRAQALEPRLYNNLPIQLNFLFLGYGYSQGDVLVDPSLPFEDLNARLHIPVIAYLRSLNLWGRSGKIDVVIPYAFLSGSARLEGDDQRVSRKISGFGDMSFRLTMNLYGAPALTLREFAKYRQGSIIGASLQVIAPVGQYDPSKLANIGANRWTIKPEVGFSQRINRLLLETSAAVHFYTTNNNFWGGRVRKQNPIVSLQGHAVYTFNNSVWAAFNVTYYRGGSTTIDGEQKNDLQTNWRLGATLAFPLSRRHSLKLYGSTGLYTRTGTAFNLVGAAWQYRWGGGV